MQSSTAVPAGIDRTSDAELAELLAAPGPFVTVYLQTDPEAQEASHTSEVHWRDLRRDLLGAGAPQSALEAIDALVPDAHRFGIAFGAVASAAGVLLVDHHDEPLRRDLGRVGALPGIGTMLEWRERRPSYVAALCDLAGADVIAVERGIPIDEEVAGDRERHDPLLHKVRSGGWSNPRYQHRVERHWEEDARAVAEKVAELAQEVGARIVLLGGEGRAVSLIEAALPAGLSAPVQTIAGSRGVDGASDETSESITRALHTAIAADHATALGALREREAKQLACTGAVDTLQALAEGRVELLLVNDDPDDERTAGFIRSPFTCAPDEGALASLGQPVERARLVDVAIAAAFASGAAVRVVPEAPQLREGIAGLLRFAEGGAAG